MGQVGCPTAGRLPGSAWDTRTILYLILFFFLLIMNTPDPFDIDSLRLQQVPIAAKPIRVPRHRAGEQFLKGPVPLDWLAVAAKLPGKALAVGLAIWFLIGLKTTNRISLTHSHLEKLDVGRKAAYRALAALEGAKLISVERHAGRSPIITVLDARPQVDNQPSQ